VQWVNENFDVFKEMQEDPYTNREWEKADKPFQFLAWCNEWVQFQEYGYGYESSFICSQDGSCNGIQHYAAILKHRGTAEAVNLSNSDVPQDVYTVVKDKGIENLKNMTDSPFAKLWLDYGVKRSTVKRPIMTSPYGSTRYSCSDFVDENLVKRKDAGEEHPFGSGKLAFEACSFMAGVIWDSMGEVLSAPRQGMDYLKKSASILAKNGHPIVWYNPVGFPVIQDYPEFKSMRVKTKLFGEVIKPRINVETEKLSVLKASNGLPPNFIHAQDSAHMMLTVSNAYDKGLTHFCNVHDSFGTLAADSQVLAETIRESFVEMYSKSCPLEDFKETIKPILNDKQKSKLPEVPEKGDFNIEEVLKSEFFFA
jgi:DNA-directed RNA polymerase